MKIQAIILAAGKGTRMKATDTNKCLFPVNGKPMIRYPLEALSKLGITKPVVVVGFAKDSIRQELGDSVIYATQELPDGTASALRAGLEKITPEVTDVIVLYGDHSTMYDEHVLQELIDSHISKQADMTLVTVVMNSPAGYGRIVRDKQGKLQEIVEEKNATDLQRQIKEINSGNGIYKVKTLVRLLPKIQKNELTQEYYLTDILKLGIDDGMRVEALRSDDEALSMGVNTPEQLAALENFARLRSH